MRIISFIRLLMQYGAIIIMASTAGCSYVTDYVEGKLTKRASFSITAEYDSVYKRVAISWHKQIDSDAPGYEIYVTRERNDEYIGYELAASCYEVEQNITLVSGDLRQQGTQHCLLDVSAIANNSALAGIYFFRVGLLEWDTSDQNDRIRDYNCHENWNQEISYNGSTCRRINYNAHSRISAVSGYAPVDIR